MLELKKIKPTSIQTNPPADPSSKKRFFSFLRRDGTHILMALPAVIWVFIFSYVPMFGLIIAFKDYRFDKGIFGSDWVGLNNFRFLITTADGWRMTRNTLGLNAIFIITQMVFAVIIAILIYRIQFHFFTRFYQASLFIPYFISWVIAGVFMFALLNSDNGLVNNLMKAAGLEPIRWYSEPKYWVGILTLTNLWKSVGFWSIIYFSGILAINPEIYEAATVDGASGWQQTIYVTLPLLSPLIIINVLLCIGKIFYADFGLFYHVTRDQGMLYATTDVIDTYVYRSLRRTGKIGMASAAGFYQAVVGFALVFLSNWIVRRIDPEKSLF